MKKIWFEDLCYYIAHCSEKEINKIEEVAKWQAQYIHPLKRATQINQNNLWKHNLKVIKKFRELQKILLEDINK